MTVFRPSRYMRIQLLDNDDHLLQFPPPPPPHTDKRLCTVRRVCGILLYKYAQISVIRTHSSPRSILNVCVNEVSNRSREFWIAASALAAVAISTGPISVNSALLKSQCMTSRLWKIFQETAKTKIKSLQICENWKVRKATKNAIFWTKEVMHFHFWCW